MKVHNFITKDSNITHIF